MGLSASYTVRRLRNRLVCFEMLSYRKLGGGCLAHVLQSKLAPCDQLFEANALQQLVSLLHSSNPTVAEVPGPILLPSLVWFRRRPTPALDFSASIPRIVEWSLDDTLAASAALESERA